MEEKRVTQQKNNAFLFGERRILTQTEQNYEEEMERLESLKKKKEEVTADRESFISNAGLTEKRIIKQIECTRNVIEVYKDQRAHLSVFAFSQKKEISARIQKEEEILRNTINELDAHREKTASDMNSFLKRNEEIEEEMRECIEKCDGLSKGIKGLEASIKAFEASEKEFTDLVDSIAAQEKLISMNMDTLRIRNDSYKKGLAK